MTLDKFRNRLAVGDDVFWASLQKNSVVEGSMNYFFGTVTAVHGEDIIYVGSIKASHGYRVGDGSPIEKHAKDLAKI